MNKKEAIIRAALELLVENGIHATPMSAIAKKAGTGMGTIYHYFPNKEMLVNDIYTSIKRDEEGLFPAFNTTEPIKIQFEQYYRIAIEYYLNNPIKFRFIDQLQNSPLITKESREAGYRSIEVVILLLKRGQAEGIFKNINVDELIQFVGGAVIAFTRWKLNDPLNVENAIKNQLKLIWDAIKE